MRFSTAPAPAFVLLPADPMLLRLTSVERVSYTPAAEAEGRAATLTLDTADQRSQIVRGPEAEALWAQLLMLHEAEWRAVQLTAQAPRLGAALGQAVATMNGATPQQEEEQTAREPPFELDVAAKGDPATTACLGAAP